MQNTLMSYLSLGLARDRDFPGGPVAKILCSQFRGPRVRFLVTKCDPTYHNSKFVCYSETSRVPHLRLDTIKEIHIFQKRKEKNVTGEVITTSPIDH